MKSGSFWTGMGDGRTVMVEGERMVIRYFFAVFCASVFTISTMSPSLAQSRRSSVTSSDAIELLDSIVSEDSRSWHYNRYLAGSVRNPEITRDSSGNVTRIVGSYDYRGFGGVFSGWVEARIQNGDLVCIRYHDYPDQCRAVGDQARYSAAPPASADCPANYDIWGNRKFGNYC